VAKFEWQLDLKFPEVYQVCILQRGKDQDHSHEPAWTFAQAKALSIGLLARWQMFVLS
jgi:hypothetical protein